MKKVDLEHSLLPEVMKEFTTSVITQNLIQMVLNLEKSKREFHIKLNKTLSKVPLEQVTRS